MAHSRKDGYEVGFTWEDSIHNVCELTCLDLQYLFNKVGRHKNVYTGGAKNDYCQGFRKSEYFEKSEFEISRFY